MEASRFTERSLGRLVEIGASVSRWAFVPEPLPEVWDVPGRLWPLVAEARQAVGRLDGAGRHMPAHELLLRPLQRREALRSSSMEGTHATPLELLLFELEPREPRAETDQVNAWREVFNYGHALAAGREHLDAGYPLSLHLIRSLHRELLAGVRGSDRHPGEFRTCQVHVGSDARYVPPPPHMLPECLEALERALRDLPRTDPLVRAFMIHYQVEAIHPFADGNGRVGRLLLSLQIYRDLGLHAPWLYLSPYFERYKDEYVDRLFRVSTHGDWEGWLEFCLRGVVSEANASMDRIDRLLALRERYRDVAHAARRGRLHAVIDRLFEFPVITIPQLARRLRVSYPTAKADVGALADLGILQEGPTRTRPKVFLAKEIMRISYDADM